MQRQTTQASERIRLGAVGDWKLIECRDLREIEKARDLLNIAAAAVI